MSGTKLDTVRIDSYARAGRLDREQENMNIHRYMNHHGRNGPLYCDLRTSLKSGYECPEEFLVHCVQDEEFPEEANISVSFKNLKVDKCSVSELGTIVADLRKGIPWFIRYLIMPFANTEKVFPNLSEVTSVVRISERSDFGWLFIEEKDKFHSLFWSIARREPLKLTT